jgi:hypothetical protein
MDQFETITTQIDQIDEENRKNELEGLLNQLKYVVHDGKMF